MEMMVVYWYHWRVRDFNKYRFDRGCPRFPNGRGFLREIPREIACR
jgi:hypothetical protein